MKNELIVDIFKKYLKWEKFKCKKSDLNQFGNNFDDADNDKDAYIVKLDGSWNIDTEIHTMCQVYMKHWTNCTDNKWYENYGRRFCDLLTVDCVFVNSENKQVSYVELGKYLIDNWNEFVSKMET